MVDIANEGGPGLSSVVAGMWRLREWGFSIGERVRYIESALELGITSFDHADIYGDYQAEALFGEALAAAPGLRAKLQLVTKCNIMLVSTQRPQHTIKHYDSSRAHIVASVERSLRALHTDVIELLLLHRPDMLLDADEVAEAFSALRDDGKVRSFGVSNFAPHQFELLRSRVPLATNQVELSPLSLSPLYDGTLDQCQRLRVRPMIWSPLAGGRLFTSDDATSARVRTTIEQVARELSVSPTTVAYAWVLRHPSRPLPITGSRRTESLAEATRALSLRLDHQTWYRITSAATGQDVP